MAAFTRMTIFLLLVGTRPLEKSFPLLCSLLFVLWIFVLNIRIRRVSNRGKMRLKRLPHVSSGGYSMLSAASIVLYHSLTTYKKHSVTWKSKEKNGLLEDTFVTI